MTDLDTDAMQSIGDLASRIVGGLSQERQWDGKTITEPGVYSGITLDQYHQKRDLLDGPSISKSALKWLLPAYGGSPKAFWGRWAWNPDHVRQNSTKAMDFGKAAHALLLGDEVFSAKFAVRPEKAPDGRNWNANNSSCAAWMDEHKHLTVITSDQIERIKRIAEDAQNYPLIQMGVLNGRVERSMFWKDEETGIWLRSRPDAMPNADGVFADLKTASKFDEDFLERQIFDAGYFLQAAMTRMICRSLGIPFETFVLVYVLNDDVPDTAHVEISAHDIDRGERVIRWCLNTIRHCLDADNWPGARPFAGGERHIQMKPWAKSRLDDFLDHQDQIAQQEAA
ncbi:PD-(D/E)XK nuclease-like domain-containing protein [Nitratireductor sp. B36]|uniref:PD-(D/E)XK nuclease-like domain-containing protein n=1 Tax=Nitratireductor sp. B36 TaxID=2762059 RepID=UPI001E3E5A33|nr:PD-(D/E)XK nuclease-like domain-containing protein [Nitratireductor sp. B36]MCC5777892.1 PD-(D/E)XK nuclease-like domain-containing protein [Nitratireductor sp. B36]